MTGSFMVSDDEAAIISVINPDKERGNPFNKSLIRVYSLTNQQTRDYPIDKPGSWHSYGRDGDRFLLSQGIKNGETYTQNMYCLTLDQFAHVSDLEPACTSYRNFQMTAPGMSDTFVTFAGQG